MILHHSSSVTGHVIETVARREGFSVIPAFAGHGIGTYFHGPPDIFHCRECYDTGLLSLGIDYRVVAQITPTQDA